MRSDVRCAARRRRFQATGSGVRRVLRPDARVSVNLLPVPTSLTTVRSPPIPCAIWRLIAKPKAGTVLRPRQLRVHLHERLEHAFEITRCDSTPGVRDGNRRCDRRALPAR